MWAWGWFAMLKILSDDEIPTVDVSEAERRAGQLEPEARREALDLFFRDGVLLLHNVFDPGLLSRAHREFMDRHGEGLMQPDLGGGIAVGHQRIMIGVEMSGPFAEPDLYASPLIGDLMGEWLGGTYRIGSFTAVAARPGAGDQKFHKDHPPIENPTDDKPYAITLMVPLVVLDGTVGGTCFVKGSQHADMEEAERMPRQVPRSVTLGSCYLMDYRLAHYGLPNRSGAIRPVLSIVHEREGFSDKVNFNQIAPLTIPDATRERMSEAHRRRFSVSSP